MNIDLTPIIQAMLALLAALVTCKLVPWIQAKASTEQRKHLEAITRVLVFAAEQIYGAGKGDEKLSYVIRQMEAHGYTVDVATIEATVFECFHYGWGIISEGDEGTDDDTRAGDVSTGGEEITEGNG